MSRPFRGRWSASAILLTIYGLGGCCCVLGAALLPESLTTVLSLTLASLFAFALVHASGRLGPRNAVVFLLLTVGISLGFELVGVLTGAVYGSYYYTDRLQPRVFGLVPVMVPVAWFTMMYISYTLAELLGRGRPDSILRKAFVGSVVMTAWDLVLDPAMVSAGYWVWTDGGAYFGIPMHNFAGWLATNFTAFLAYGFCERPCGRRRSIRASARLTLAAYALTGLASIAAGLTVGQRGPALIGLVAIGSILLVGLMRAGYVAGPAPLPATVRDSAEGMLTATSGSHRLSNLSSSSVHGSS